MPQALKIDWPRNDYSRVPFRLYHDESVYALEMERIFPRPGVELPRARGGAAESRRLPHDLDRGLPRSSSRARRTARSTRS